MKNVFLFSFFKMRGWGGLYSLCTRAIPETTRICCCLRDGAAFPAEDDPH